MTRHRAAGSRPTPIAASLASMPAMLAGVTLLLGGIVLAAAAQPADPPPPGFNTLRACDAELAR